MWDPAFVNTLPRMADDIPQAEGVGHRFIHANGIWIHVAEAGSADAPAVLLLHGWPQHWYMWRRVIGDLRGVLFGERDRYVSPKLLAGYQPHADDMEVELVPNSGHFIVEEQPDLVVSRVRDFLRSD